MSFFQNFWPQANTLRSNSIFEVERNDRENATPKKAQDAIAIVGMACRLPGNCNSPNSLWRFLEKGGIAQNEPPESRFTLKTHYDGSGKPKTQRSPGGMFLENVDIQAFDAQFFSISAAEATAMDPQQRQLLEVVYECLENAGISLASLSNAQAGCFVGSSTIDYRDIQSRDPIDRPPSTTSGLVPAILSNRVSHYLNIRGPSMTIDTACSASLVALDVACKYILTGEINTAIVGATHLYLSPEHNLDSGAMREAFSPTGKCHTFDAKADGYIKAEGVNALVIKRLSDAVRDGDPIRAVIRGSASNNNGRGPGLSAPSSEAQASAMRTAYANAGIEDFSATSFLECHGTGTQAGDPAEVAAASSVLCSGRSGEPLVIGSIKSNIGHSEGSAGISSVLKAVLALEKGTIPGTPTFITPNPNIHFKRLKVKATRGSIAWPRVPLRRAGINSFGFGGSNAHAILDEARLWAKSAHVSSFQNIDEADDFFGDEDPMHDRAFILVFSANDDKSLQGYVQRLRKHLVQPSAKVQLPDLAYTLCQRRTHHFHRGFVFTNKAVFHPMAVISGKKTPDAPRIAFVFTGQGAQWPQMGKLLVDRFPLAQELLRSFDAILKQTQSPPSWSFLRELTTARSTEEFRRPELSQPLVTALQIVIVEILKSWGIQPQAVIGHSSGEIAAAYCAGHLTMADAIKIATFRGQASGKSLSDSKTALGMLAVGLGADEAKKYLNEYEDEVEIACYNSPNSITLSGTVSALENVRKTLDRSGHTARMLHVNMAYHSKYMKEISTAYRELLDQDCQLSVQSSGSPSGKVRMFSSLLGKQLNCQTDAAYWQANLTSPVLFDRAVQEMVYGRNGADFLIEIGPSGALAAPIAEIKAGLPNTGSNIQSFTSFQRAQKDLKCLFEIPGRLFISGGSVDLAAINKEKDVKPNVIIDLPNYSWNHSTRYWHESEASKDWRFRLFPNHDLIGSKVLGTSYYAPVWKKILRVDDLAWLKDHRLGSDIVLPGAALIAMAVESISQVGEALSILDNKPLPRNVCYRLRNTTFLKALVLEEGKRHDIMLNLGVRTGSRDWYEFKILSAANEGWVEHCKGLVRIDENQQIVASEEAMKPLEHSAPGELWYKAMSDAGYSLGPAFQQHLEYEATSGQPRSRSIIRLTEPSSNWSQSYYPLHPACLDAILQASGPAMWSGDRASMHSLLVPAIIDDILICPKPSSCKTGLVVITSNYVGVGNPDDVTSYAADINMYDSDTGLLLFQASKLKTFILDTHDTSQSAGKFCQLTWKPDVTFLSQEHLSRYLANGIKSTDEEVVLNRLINLIVHKAPNLKVCEAVMIPGTSSSIWLDGQLDDSGIRLTCDIFTLCCIDPRAMLSAKESYASRKSVDFSVLDLASALSVKDCQIQDVGLLIVKFSTASEWSNPLLLSTVAHNCRQMLREDGYVLFLEQSEGGVEGNSLWHSRLEQVLRNSFDVLRNVPISSSAKWGSALLARAMPVANAARRKIRLFHFLQLTDLHHKIMEGLQDFGWDITEHTSSVDHLNSNETILILDDLYSSVLSNITQDQWAAFKTLTVLPNEVVWVTQGSHFKVSNPDKATIHGFLRTIREEDPTIGFTTLDVESATGESTIPAINTTLDFVKSPASRKALDFEIVERGGVLHVGRAFQDYVLNRFATSERSGPELVDMPLHDNDSTIRLQSERAGNLDSLHFNQTSDEEFDLAEDEVEIDIVAAGMNFKDVAVSTGLIPENTKLLGHEGAGRIKRSGSSYYTVGQRVLFSKTGAFANKIVATTEQVHLIPDSMSFEEAATLAGVYSVAIYSLFDLANTQAGQRVLIHSAAGGLGIACIQLCKYLGAEIYATVGTNEKKQWLIDNYNIPSSRIFNSRSTSFAQGLLNETNNEGVDVVINSLVGDLLEASWQCVRAGGTMVELGKKDLLDRNYLPMEHFARNTSYRSFDISHRSVPNSLRARLLKQMFELIDRGHIKPLPMKVFSFKEITSAFRHMQNAKHIGKIVISDGSETESVLPVRPLRPKFKLHDDVSYLVVGGLKGLCGSLVINFARQGAKYITVMGRSGFDDKISQRVIHDIKARCCSLNLIQGDVTVVDDVRSAFQTSEKPVGGIIQGAMVVRGKVYDAMTVDDYHEAVTCKVAGTWNLHNVALENNLTLDFFTMLSSTSGIAGQQGQANYTAANAFLDAFAIYRQGLGLRANSIALGPLWDVGYMSRNVENLPKTNTSSFTQITEPQFLQIIEYSITQQISPINEESSSHLITGMAIPLRETSTLRSDARFAGLFSGNATTRARTADNKNDSNELQVFNLLLEQGTTDSTQLLNVTVDLVGKQLMMSFRLNEAIEPAKPLSSYGMESLAAVELRNWVRMELQADLSMLEIQNATSLVALCEKILGRIRKGKVR